MRKTTYILGGLVLILSITFCTLAVISAKAETRTAARPECCYTSIKIGMDETLDTIAEEYNTAGFYSDEEYVNEIKRINNLYTDRIHPGCFLTVMNF